AAATEDPHVTLRLAAVRIVAQRLGLGTTADALLRRLDRDPDWRIRDVALQSLLRSPQGARAAAMALADRHRKLREQARAAVATSPSAATVFPGGALIERSGTVHLSQGLQRLALGGLPARMDDASVRIRVSRGTHLVGFAVEQVPVAEVVSPAALALEKEE